MTSQWMSVQESCSQSWYAFALRFSSIYAKDIHAFLRVHPVQVSILTFITLLLR